MEDIGGYLYDERGILEILIYCNAHLKGGARKERMGRFDTKFTSI